MLSDYCILFRTNMGDGSVRSKNEVGPQYCSNACGSVTCLGDKYKLG